MEKETSIDKRIGEKDNNKKVYHAGRAIGITAYPVQIVILFNTIDYNIIWNFNVTEKIYLRKY